MFLNLKKKYCVLLEGGNVLMELNARTRLGFFTTRYVKAKDMDEAAEQSLEIVRKELGLTGALLNTEDDPPTLTVSEINEVGYFSNVRGPGRGFTFFSEG
jgi:hypothetical protein